MDSGTSSTYHCCGALQSIYLKSVVSVKQRHICLCTLHYSVLQNQETNRILCFSLSDTISTSFSTVRRDIEQQALSPFHHNSKNLSVVLTQRTFELLEERTAIEKTSHNTYDIFMEDFNVENYTKLARWLGATCSFKKNHHNKLSTVKDGPNQYG